MQAKQGRLVCATRLNLSNHQVVLLPVGGVRPQHQLLRGVFLARELLPGLLATGRKEQRSCVGKRSSMYSSSKSVMRDDSPEATAQSAKATPTRA